MKFGLECEKFLFDLKKQRPSNGVFRFIDALIDYDPHSLRNITNEFVLNMVEIVTAASESPQNVLKNYVLDYLLFNSVAKREAVTMVGMGSLPVDYLPHMTPKWAYYVQNSILDGKLQSSWMMTKETPLTPAGNCAGIHIHTEVETPPEYLFSSRELQDKFNLSLMLTPMIAFASSPYFFGEHNANSMRGEKYYFDLYKNYPLNGGLPPVMTSSQEVLLYFKEATDFWVEKGISVGLPEEDLTHLIRKKGASWNPVRWNRTWNTIELRAFDSDRIDLDCAKFIWATSAMKRTDLKGEALQCVPLKGELSADLINQTFAVENGKVFILPTEAIRELFRRAITDGLRDDLVLSYLKRLGDFAQSTVEPEMLSLFTMLKQMLEKRESTSGELLEISGKSSEITETDALKLINTAIKCEQDILRKFTENFPDMSLQYSRFLN